MMEKKRDKHEQPSWNTAICSLVEPAAARNGISMRFDGVIGNHLARSSVRGFRSIAPAERPRCGEDACMLASHRGVHTSSTRS